MKYRRITLGMGYGDYWNDHNAFEANTKTSILIGTVEQQQSIIQKQKTEIEEIKIKVAELQSQQKKISLKK